MLSERPREAARASALDAVRRGASDEEVMGAVRQAAHVTPELRLACIRNAIALSVTVIVAPFEADGQLAHLARSGRVDRVMTNDGDLGALGCNVVRLDSRCPLTWLEDGVLATYDSAFEVQPTRPAGVWPGQVDIEEIVCGRRNRGPCRPERRDERTKSEAQAPYRQLCQGTRVLETVDKCNVARRRSSPAPACRRHHAIAKQVLCTFTRTRGGDNHVSVMQVRSGR